MNLQNKIILHTLSAIMLLVVILLSSIVQYKDFKAKDPEQAKSIYCELEGFDKTAMSSKIYILGLRN